MDKDTDAKLYAAALYVITDIWGQEMGDLQRASLANQIVREIERRGIAMSVADERAACARIAVSHADGSDCEDRGMMDPETGEVPCAAERRGEVCVCAERHDLAFQIADKIRARN